MNKNLIIPSVKEWYKQADFERRLQKALPDIEDAEVVFIEDISLGIQENIPFIILPDGRRINKGDPDMPSWALFHGSSKNPISCFEQLGIRCFSSSEMVKLDRNKIDSQMLFADIFRMPDTLFYQGEYNCRMLPPSDYPFIVKADSGSGGKMYGLLPTENT